MGGTTNIGSSIPEAHHASSSDAIINERSSADGSGVVPCRQQNVCVSGSAGVYSPSSGNRDVDLAQRAPPESGGEDARWTSTSIRINDAWPGKPLLHESHSQWMAAVRPGKELLPTGTELSSDAENYSMPVPRPGTSAAPKCTSEEMQTVDAALYGKTLPLYTSGNSRAFFNGLVVVGPEVWHFIGSLVGLIVPLAIDTAFMADSLPWGATFFLWILWGLSTIALIKTAISDPGIAQRRQQDVPVPEYVSVVISIQRPARGSPLLLLNPCKSLCGQGKGDDTNDANNQSITIEKHTVQLRYCYICCIYRSPRTHHCRCCDNCVDVFDHHCPWTGTCIGVKNYHYFIIFLLSTNAYILWHMILCTWGPVRYAFHHEMALATALRKELYMPVVMFAVALLTGYSIFGLLFYHLYITSLGVTTLEHIRQMWLQPGLVDDSKAIESAETANAEAVRRRREYIWSRRSAMANLWARFTGQYEKNQISETYKPVLVEQLKLLGGNHFNTFTEEDTMRQQQTLNGGRVDSSYSTPHSSISSMSNEIENRSEERHPVTGKTYTHGGEALNGSSLYLYPQRTDSCVPGLATSQCAPAGESMSSSQKSILEHSSINIENTTSPPVSLSEENSSHFPTPSPLLGDNVKHLDTILVTETAMSGSAPLTVVRSSSVLPAEYTSRAHALTSNDSSEIYVQQQMPKSV